MPRRQIVQATQDGEYFPESPIVHSTHHPSETEPAATLDDCSEMPQSTGEEIIVQAGRSRTIVTHARDRLARTPSPNLQQIDIFRRYVPIQSHRRAYIAAREAGWFALVELALQFEQRHRQWPQEVIDDYASHMFIVLLSTDRQILDQHCNGTFVHTYFADAAFQARIDSMLERALLEDQPIIYRCTIADESGHGHNRQELRECLQVIQDFVGGRRRAVVQGINMQLRQPDDATLHETLKGLGPISEDAVQSFIGNTLETDSAFHSPLVYVGGAWRPQKRRTQHQHYTSGLMGLFLAASRLLYGQQFRLHFHPLFLCYEPAQLVAGEMLFEGLGATSIAHGCGFNCDRAGKLPRKPRVQPDQMSWAWWALRNANSSELLNNIEQLSAEDEEWRTAKSAWRTVVKIEAHAEYMRNRDQQY